MSEGVESGGRRRSLADVQGLLAVVLLAGGAWAVWGGGVAAMVGGVALFVEAVLARLSGGAE